MLPKVVQNEVGKKCIQKPIKQSINIFIDVERILEQHGTGFGAKNQSKNDFWVGFWRPPETLTELRPSCGGAAGTVLSRPPAPGSGGIIKTKEEL